MLDLRRAAGGPSGAPAAVRNRDLLRRMLSGVQSNTTEGENRNKSERQDLLQICRQRARVAKTEAPPPPPAQSRVEAQLATIYHFDNDEVWREMHAAAQAAWEVASQRINQRSKELGIPRE